MKTPPPVEVVVAAPAVMFWWPVWTTVKNWVLGVPRKLVVMRSWLPETMIKAPPCLKEESVGVTLPRYTGRGTSE